MCKALHINYNILAKRNHKGFLVEKFHRFINKTIAIATEDRDTNDVFVTAGVVAGYAWTSSPTDGINILHSVPAIGRELRFPLKIVLNALPPIVSNNTESVFSYLRLKDSNRYFSFTVLKILIENRRTIYAERINNILL